MYVHLRHVIGKNGSQTHKIFCKLPFYWHLYNRNYYRACYNLVLNNYLLVSMLLTRYYFTFSKILFSFKF